MLFIERRVDFLGIPIRKTHPKPGHKEELSRPPWRRLFKRDHEAFGELSMIEVFSREGVIWKSGYYEVETITLGADRILQVVEDTQTVTKEQINYLPKRPRRKSGKRVSFVYR